MRNFRIVKKGYSQVEVDEYISRLVNDYETTLSEQKDRIFYLKDQLDKITKSSDKELITSLVSALERARIIENSSRNIYELETKKLSLLYNKMETTINNKSGLKEADLKNELLNLIQDCRRSLQENIIMQNENLKEPDIGDPVRRLLSKMINFNSLSLGGNGEKINNNKTRVQNPKINKALIANAKKEERKENKKVEPKKEAPKKVEAKSEEVKKEEKTPTKKEIKIAKKEQRKKEKEEARIEKQQQKKIVVAKKQENKEPETNNFNKYLSDEKDLDGGNFANIMFSGSNKHANSNYITKKDIGDYTPNETGFDLKEAVNPKEELEDIMKAFDFYNDNKKKK